MEAQVIEKSANILFEDKAIEAAVLERIEYAKTILKPGQRAMVFLDNGGVYFLLDPNPETPNPQRLNTFYKGQRIVGLANG